MPNSIRAKFKVRTISNHYTYPQAAANGEICQEVNLAPVSGEGAEENKSLLTTKSKYGNFTQHR